jgi:hypothetical protein
VASRVFSFGLESIKRILRRLALTVKQAEAAWNEAFARLKDCVEKENQASLAEVAWRD